MVAYTFYESDNRVMRYSEALLERGDTVDVFALRQDGQEGFERYQGVNLYRIQRRQMRERKSKVFYLFRLIRFLFKTFWAITYRHLSDPYRIVHVHSVPDFEVFAAIVPRLLGAKVILDIHDIVPEFYCSKFNVMRESPVFDLLVAVERASIRFADHAIVANDIWRERLLSRSAVAEKCTTIMNYPDPQLFFRRPKSRTDDRFIMMYPGTINHHQGLDIAVRAVATILKVVPNFQLHIYGDGPDRESLECLVRELSLESSVFIFDMLPIVDVVGRMANADLGVVPKRRDSFGDEAFSTKTLEFMSLGIPLVVADTTIDTRFFDPACVAFFEAGNSGDLARTVLQLCRDSSARERLAEEGLRFLSRHNWEDEKKRYLRLL